jgi:hypothetical protein
MFNLLRLERGHSWFGMFLPPRPGLTEWEAAEWGQALAAYARYFTPQPREP